MVKNLLKNKNLRATPFREQVLDIFLDKNNAISVQDIESSLGKFDRITLYRTIKAFIEKGIIHEIVMPGDIKMLALCADDCSSDNHIHSHQHIHFRCNQCENVFCIDLVDFPEISIPNFKLNSVEIQGSGVCDKCGN